MAEYVLFTEVTVEPVEAVEDTNGARKSICGVIWHTSMSELHGHGGRVRSMEQAVDAAGCMPGGERCELHAAGSSAWELAGSTLTCWAACGTDSGCGQCNAE